MSKRKLKAGSGSVGRVNTRHFCVLQMPIHKIYGGFFMSQSLVSLVRGCPTVSSLNVSEHFEKRHTHVVDVVRRIVSDCAPEFSEPNFRLAEYTDDQGKPRPMYNLTRDGFTLVAMGFTGKKALEWKIRY
ncbi:MAG: Rha family transcriptional regulator, partial [Desulfovibrionaceae bacterium]|nr:Rha family transcriptional regulator [Desulfovibrionaceae bacterium]